MAGDMKRTLLALIIGTPIWAAGVQAPDKFDEQAETRGAIVDSTVEKWWTTLKDPELDALIERAVQSNPDLKLAGQRLLEARAARRITKSALLPSINSVDSFQRIRGGFEGGNVHAGDNPGGGIFVSPFESNIFQLGFDSSWEIDLFGGRRHELQAATAEVSESEHN